MGGRGWALLVGASSAAVLLGQWLGRTSGSTRAERRRSLPLENLVRHPNVTTNHARTLPASQDAVWPWLMQVGWHRAGWYTPRWVDKALFPDNWPSATELVPDLVRELAIGDTVPDGPAGTAEFVVEPVDQPNVLVLHSRTHIPTSWQQRSGARIDWLWTFALDETEPGGSRMLIRTVARTDPWWLTALYMAVLVPADHIMATGMLRGLERRVSATGSGAGGALTPHGRLHPPANP